MTGIETSHDVHDLIRGLTLLGTGGGGRPDLGLEALLPHVVGGRRIGWTRPEEVSDDAWVCSVFGMGSIAPIEPLSTEQRITLGYPERWAISKPMVRAVEELQAYSGRTIAAVIPFELGAANTAVPMDAAVSLSLTIIDGDLAGRAIPELSQTTAALAGVPFTPGVVADPWGNVLIIKEIASALVAERIGKLISMATKLPDMRAPCAHAGFLMQGRTLKAVVVPGGISRALTVGRAVRQALEAGDDALAAAARALDGWVLFRGRVTKKVWENRDGYTFGSTSLEGEREDQGHRLEIWFKNENHVTWRDGSPWVLSPDLIMVMDSETGTPYTNTLLLEGARVGVLGARADARLRTPDALACHGPRHYGYDLEYTPIEALVKR